MNTNQCPSCGAQVAAHAKECQYCGGELTPIPQQQPQYTQPPQQPMYGQPQAPPYGQGGQPYYPPQPQYGQPQPLYTVRKSKVVAGLLGIFLGGLGIHKFYLGRIGWGIVYLIFCWTYIPAIVGFIEGIVYLASNEENFHAKYSKRYS